MSENVLSVWYLMHSCNRAPLEATVTQEERETHRGEVTCPGPYNRVQKQESLPGRLTPEHAHFYGASQLDRAWRNPCRSQPRFLGTTAPAGASASPSTPDRDTGVSLEAAPSGGLELHVSENLRGMGRARKKGEGRPLARLRN